MADADSSRGTKRAAPPSTSALQKVRAQVLAQMSQLSGKEVAELESAVAAAPEATVLELGLTSAQGVTLKGWVFKTLEAELTTFQLLKQPLNLVIEAIGAALRLEYCVSRMQLTDPLCFILLLLCCWSRCGAARGPRCDDSSSA